MRVVFDNNVLISAAMLKNSIPYLAFKKAVFESDILRTEKSVNELYKTINKAKFDKYFKPPNYKDEFLVSFITYSTNIIVSNKITECRDPKDNIYLELALSGNADCIITGDHDLLVLNPFRGIPVITPKIFLRDY